MFLFSLYFKLPEVHFTENETICSLAENINAMSSLIRVLKKENAQIPLLLKTEYQTCVSAIC